MIEEQEYQQTLDWLQTLKWFGIQPGLKRISAAMEKLGNPQSKLKIIHVTGTNGKGSVCAMLSAILQKAGYRVGMFTSPPLTDLRERFQINGERMGKEDVVSIASILRETEIELTFFEFMTAMAFAYFEENVVDYAIMEVGMGGRFDATNIVAKPLATVITSLSLDHTDWLGDTLDKIAWEKAGIAKECVPLFTTVKNNVIESECGEKNAPLILVDGKESTNMNGEFQRSNAALAAAVARYMKIPEGKIKEGLLSTYWPGRLEFIEKNVLLDCAHNLDGITRMTDFVETLSYRKLIIVFGVMKDKNYSEMISKLPEYDNIILTKPKIDRAADPKDVRKVCNSSNAAVVEDVTSAYVYAKSISEEVDLILICGSCYLVGEVLAHRNNIPMHPVMYVQ